jgi:hypothetical protein
MLRKKRGEFVGRALSSEAKSRAENIHELGLREGWVAECGEETERKKKSFLNRGEWGGGQTERRQEKALCVKT